MLDDIFRRLNDYLAGRVRFEDPTRFMADLDIGRSGAYEPESDFLTLGVVVSRHTETRGFGELFPETPTWFRLEAPFEGERVRLRYTFPKKLATSQNPRTAAAFFETIFQEVEKTRKIMYFGAEDRYRAFREMDILKSYFYEERPPLTDLGLWHLETPQALFDSVQRFKVERTAELSAVLHSRVFAASILQNTTPQPFSDALILRGVRGADMGLDAPPAHSCVKCHAENLTNFRRGSDGILCGDCFDSKKCADCGENDLSDIYTSQRDQREICGECFAKLNKKGRAREKGFRLNGNAYVDPEIAEKEKLRERRVENSMVYAEGLRDDPDIQVKTKSHAARIMREAGCRYVAEALKKVSFKPKPKTSDASYDRLRLEETRRFQENMGITENGFGSHSATEMEDIENNMGITSMPLSDTELQGTRTGHLSGRTLERVRRSTNEVEELSDYAFDAVGDLNNTVAVFDSILQENTGPIVPPQGTVPLPSTATITFDDDIEITSARQDDSPARSCYDDLSTRRVAVQRDPTLARFPGAALTRFFRELNIREKSAREALCLKVLS